MSLRLRVALVMAGICTVLAVIAGALFAESADPTASECTFAAVELVQFHGEPLQSIDEIQVQLAAHSPAAGSVDVRVSTPEADRVVHIRGPGARGLSFEPALAASTFELSIEPAGGPRDACVATVTLLDRGRVVAIVAP